MIRTQVQCLFFFYSNDVFQKENEKYENFIPTISTSPAPKQNKTSYVEKRTQSFELMLVY